MIAGTPSSARGEPAATDTVRFQDPSLEHLRAILVYKSQVASGRFADLVAGLDNPPLQEVLRSIADDAEEEKEVLADVIADWMRHEAPDAAPRTMEPSTRELVETWVTLQEAAALRYHEAALLAPSPALRARLEQLAQRDGVHARLLRALL